MGGVESEEKSMLPTWVRSCSESSILHFHAVISVILTCAAHAQTRAHESEENEAQVVPLRKEYTRAEVRRKLNTLGYALTSPFVRVQSGYRAVQIRLYVCTCSRTWTFVRESER